MESGLTNSELKDFLDEKSFQYNQKKFINSIKKITTDMQLTNIKALRAEACFKFNSFNFRVLCWFYNCY